MQKTDTYAQKLAFAESLIAAEHYYSVPGSTCIICALVLENSFAVTGVSHCLNSGEFDTAKGRALARENAIAEIIHVEAYRCYQRTTGAPESSVCISAGVVKIEGDASVTVKEAHQDGFVGQMTRARHERLKRLVDAGDEAGLIRAIFDPRLVVEDNSDGAGSTNALGPVQVTDDATKSSAKVMQTKPYEPVSERINSFNRLISAIRAEFSDAEMIQDGFEESVWQVIQVLCGPIRAAQIIRWAQVEG
ncbi:TPA: Gp49 family protein [Enterobacter ludwigii]